MTGNDAAAEYPDVPRLAELGERGGWRFTVRTDVKGQQITGVRAWPDGSADVLIVDNLTVAWAQRTNPEGAVVWRHEEARLGEVADSLLELPAPDDPRAPTHVVAPGVGLWGLSE